MKEMRRQDRKSVDPERIAEVLNKARTMHLGFSDEGQVYIVPLNYGWVEKDGCYTLYAHSAGEGRKIDLVRDGADVGFEMDCDVSYFSADIACGWGNHFKSIIGEGQATLCRSAEEKRVGLTAIMHHYMQQEHFPFEENAATVQEHAEHAAVAFAEEMVERVQVIRIDVTALSCKINEA